ncbi:exopolysaccharide biosynthesis protein [Pacificibacter sp. AS14]|uniref:exopolysaccharide biosynthesis protein n=1 Tax=Pacificibacter sp. AS14 TaxID=3135785 RepID=UPI003179A8AF
MTTNSTTTDTVSGIIDKSVEVAHGRDKVCVADLVASLGRQVLLSMLLLPALAVVTPLSGIPGFSSLCGITIALVGMQLLWERDTIWLPDWIMRRKLSAARLEKAVKWLDGVATWCDKISRPRLQVLVQKPGAIFAQIMCILSGAAMPFLELVPFSSSMLAVAISLFAVGLVMRDGLFVLVGFFVFLGAGVVVVCVADYIF